MTHGHHAHGRDAHGHGHHGRERVCDLLLGLSASLSVLSEYGFLSALHVSDGHESVPHDRLPVHDFGCAELGKRSPADSHHTLQL